MHRTTRQGPQEAFPGDPGEVGLSATRYCRDARGSAANHMNVRIFKHQVPQSLVILMIVEALVFFGAPYLAEGMAVTRMAISEQAEPRADDPQ